MGDTSEENGDIAAAPDGIPKIDIREEPEWTQPPEEVPFGQRASLEIARWVLSIFAGVVLFALVVAVVLMLREDATFENSFELVKFMIHVTLPLTTLAVGYYLGDRTTPSET